MNAEWRKFSMLCNELRSVKNSKGVAGAVEKLQSFLSDDRSRQLVHRWRSWGFLLNCLLHVLKEEMRVYLNIGGAGRKRKSSARPKMPQLRYWHYLRTELETAHVTADGPMLHLDPNGRDCICQLFTFSVAVIDRQTSIEFDQSFETLVDKEAWLTVEVLVQYRVYCAVLDYKDWKNMLQLALGSISPKFDGNLIGDADTAATRARVIRFLVKNCPFDLNGEVLAGLVEEIENWFEAGKGESMERDADSLLLVIASTLLETLTDLMKTYFGSMGPYLLKRGVTILEFIVKSNKARKNGLRGAPAEFLMLFFELYQHNEAPEPEFCYLPPAKLLREMKKLIQVAMGTDEINLLMTHFNSAREQRLGNALGIDDQGIRHLACTADIIFYHDCLVSDQMQTNGSLAQDEDLFDPVVVGSKRPRSISTVLAWETVIEQFYDSPRTDTQYMTASSASPASQRQSSTLSYLSRGSSQTQRTETKQINDSGSWLLLLLSILSRHGDYYVSNRIGDLMMVMQKLSDMLIVKEMGKWQALTLQILIQESSDPVLNACSALCAGRMDLAVFLFPYALESILRTADGAKNFEDGTKTDSSGKEPSRISKAANQVDVDLLAVAKAAVRVKMPYSAMQYAEMWLEKKHGGKITSLSSLDSNEMGSNLRDILVEAYSFDSDDDGIYGVNDGRTMKSQLVKYNREGEYAKALPLYDVSLQFSLQTGAELMNSNQPRLVEGILTSLHSLGYNHLLEGYLQSLQRNESGESPGSASAQALENKYKLAWKSMQWEAVLPTWSSLTTGNTSTASFSQQQTIYQSLRAIAHGDFTHLQRVTTDAKEQILQSVQLSLHSFESTKDSYSALVDLQAIHEIEELANHIQEVSSVRDTPILSTGTITGLRPYSSLDEALVVPRVEALTAMPLLERWQKRRGQIKNDFDKAESLLALEEILLQVSKPADGAQVITKLYLDLASLSRKAGRTAVAYRALLKLEQLETRGSLSIYETMQWRIQKAKLMWKQQEPRSAIWTGKKISSDLTTYLQDSSLAATEVASLQLLQVKVLTITGKWIASQRSESSQVILEEFFTKATETISSMDTEAISDRSRDAAKAHFALAEFMAAMHQQVSARVTSREWLAGKKVVKARHDELQELQTMEQTMQNENRAHIHALNKEVVHDMNERSKVEASVDQFLIGALCSYGKGLTLSSQAELDMVFRVLSLWFNNQRKADINRVFIEEIIDMVPSYKLVPLSYQIISRISSSSDAGTFQTALRKLVMKLSVQHPHHTLVQLISLKNSGDVEGKGALQFRTNVGDAKAEGTKAYLTELMKTEQRELLESLDSMANAYVQLALFDTSEYHGHKKKIALSIVPIFETNSGRSGATPFDQCLRVRARRGESVVMPAVLTSCIPPQADLDYSNVARMYSFEPQFSITDSGIHRPKIIYCYGSDGERYKQLVKGQDDTRQDLVIEQVFETMNQFLTEEKATRNRKLRLRTYRVVPLSPIAGVLEWVENTIPWGSYLVNRSSKRLSAHERYHPHEWKHAECRQYLKNASDKLTAFLEIQKNFTPVFHHFFLEKFPDAAVWYRRRLAYVQSAAVTSIVGYILGIGDRHSQNILIHEETGELVHIDFGVVFDQGMALYTPETVPFRLTRDMVDGMGVSGVDGVFSRCCEVTLQLLRKKSASVVTILEVFVHDPLYRWTLSPLKALRIQGGEQGTKSVRSRNSSRSNSSFNGTRDGRLDEEMHAGPGSTDAAARALIRVKQKLEGYEDPNGSALSIEGQVKQLMSVAQDPHNLCKLFPGWAPWL
ncbi:hypothetical protein JG687_00000904 [Phytophthora cactorum]|uniref:non-specific serine/threonine protein kinase n=1 Tax=Phytophthora cactorum TaxID=29920 RepID=A0A8T1UZS2_9STRA|nr:hypothetical protein JG687_00000904 [Phytophthora cactorum]